jgi:ribosome-binding protein aMBF1 (putative translation factor)
MITCDLCGKAKECLQKEIDGKEYDICQDCWTALTQRLERKGRPISRQIVLLPPREPEEPDESPQPGVPPKIWGDSARI